jgi:cyclase
MRILVMALGLFIVLSTARAAQPAASKLKSEKVAEGIFLIGNAGGNIGVIVTPKHLVLVDAGLRALGDEVIRAIRSISTNPVKYVVVTHYHDDHTGSCAALVRQGAILVSHANTRHHWTEEEGNPKDVKPELCFAAAKDAPSSMDMEVDGTTIHLQHLGPGHTDGDVMVELAGGKVVFMGDLFFHGLVPFIDNSTGGSLDNVIARFGECMSRFSYDVVLVPGHGPVTNKKELGRTRDFLKAAAAHVQANPGKGGKELAATFDRTPWADFKDAGSPVDYLTFFSMAAKTR